MKGRIVPIPFVDTRTITKMVQCAEFSNSPCVSQGFVAGALLFLINMEMNKAGHGYQWQSLGSLFFGGGAWSFSLLNMTVVLNVHIILVILVVFVYLVVMVVAIVIIVVAIIFLFLLLLWSLSLELQLLSLEL